jgi:hypothetical protein
MRSDYNPQDDASMMEDSWEDLGDIPIIEKDEVSLLPIEATEVDAL